MKIGLVVNKGKHLARAMLERAAAHARRRGFGIVSNAEAPVADCPFWESRPALDGGFDGAKAIIVLGGDGTLLNAIHRIGASAAPFLGVNIGSLGYLSATDGAHFEQAIDAALAGDLDISQRQMLAAAIVAPDGTRTELPKRALNEIVLYRNTGRIVHISLLLDGTRVTDYSCDGIIVATPTGSTAYSLSAGGPLVMPGAGATIVNVICPHALSSRPILVSDKTLVTLCPIRASAAPSIAFDGVDVGEIAVGSSLEIFTAPETASIAFLKGHSDFAILSHKLGWTGSAPELSQQGGEQ